MPTLVSLSALLAKMTAIFAKADPDQIADLNDSLDISNGKVVQDLWTGGRPPAPDVGPNQAMAGGRAADKFVADYSSPTSNNESPTALLGKLVSRMDSMDAALKALLNEVFVKGDAEDEDDEESADTRADDDDKFPEGQAAARKGNAIETMTVADAMSYITGRIETRKAKAAKLQQAERIAKSANYMNMSGLATPPDMSGATAIAKSGPSLKAIVESRLDGGDYMGGIEATNLRLLHGAIRASERGLDGALERVQILRQKLAI